MVWKPRVGPVTFGDFTKMHILEEETDMRLTGLKARR